MPLPGENIGKYSIARRQLVVENGTGRNLDIKEFGVDPDLTDRALTPSTMPQTILIVTPSFTA